MNDSTEQDRATPPEPSSEVVGDAVESAARAMCDRVNGIGDYDENIDQRRAGWVSQAQAGVAAYLAVTARMEASVCPCAVCREARCTLASRQPTPAPAADAEVRAAFYAGYLAACDVTKYDVDRAWAEYAAASPKASAVAIGAGRMTEEWCLNMARLEEGQEIGAGAMDHPLRTKCEVPPAGWVCSREPGHDGPCAATAVAIGAGEVHQAATSAIEAAALCVENDDLARITGQGARLAARIRALAPASASIPADVERLARRTVEVARSTHGIILERFGIDAGQYLAGLALATDDLSDALAARPSTKGAADTPPE